MREKYTLTMIKFLKDNALKYETKALTDLFNKTFNTNLSLDSLIHYLKRHNILYKKHVKHVMKYTPEMNYFLKANSQKYDTRELAILFNKKFDKNINTRQVRKALKARNLKYKKCEKKVIESPVGSEHIYKSENHIYVKISNRDEHKNYKKGIVLKHHYLWEKEHGAIPNGHHIIFLDKNPFNFELDNLECVSRIEQLLLKRCGLHFNNKEQTKTGLAIIRHRLAILKILTKGMSSEEEKRSAKKKLNYLESRR